MRRVYLRALERTFDLTQAALRLGARAGFVWLDGGQTYGTEGRWSFLGCEPVARVEAPLGSSDALALLARLTPAADGEHHTTGPLAPWDVPLWAGAIAYDAHDFPRAKGLHPRHGTVALSFARYRAWLAFDHATHTPYLVGDSSSDCDALGEQLSGPALTPAALSFHTSQLCVTPGDAHAEAVRRALAHIRDGDVYEINLARRFEARFSGEPLGLYLAMRTLSPVPLGMYFAAPDLQLLGRSMERYLRFDAAHGRLWTSPIKGTLARHAHSRGTEGAQLVADPKEHAEHAMVVDLMRNDLSRVCVPGSVEVDALMNVHPFAGLFHLISTVSGSTQPGITLQEAVRHTFPPGSVTGTPKQRALEIIEALEPAARGIYTGAYGFVDRAGGISLAVAIRTAVVHAGSVTYWAGGGIVAKSDPAREVAETDLKARMFCEALGMGQGASAPA
jgi:anthranilate/para-aminobenzoate synthase component I